MPCRPCWGINWKLGLPYDATVDPDWVATPPGSALLLSSSFPPDDKEPVVELSYLYPVVDWSDTPGNETFRLEQTPVGFMAIPGIISPPRNDHQSRGPHPGVTVVGLDSLKARCQAVLQQQYGFPAAPLTEYVNRYVDPQGSLQEWDTPAAHYCHGLEWGMVGATAVVLLGLGWGFARKRCRRKAGATIAPSPNHYSAVDPSSIEVT